MKYLLALFASMAFAGLSTTSAEASDWGCEVLLCAASSNPSWRGVESCQPPMEKLISAMKKPGFSWPTCPEGGAGEPGYEQFAECPAGWTPASGDSDDSSSSSRAKSRCMRAVNQCKGRQHLFGSGNVEQRRTTSDGVTRVYSTSSSCSYTEFKARPLRQDPHYFDLRDETTRQSRRFWFSLER